jgi:hypothetical protein
MKLEEMRQELEALAAVDHQATLAEAAAIDAEMAELEAKLAAIEEAELQAAMVREVEALQSDADHHHDQFAAGVEVLYSAWAQVEAILREAEELRADLADARDKAKEMGDLAPSELKALAWDNCIPESLYKHFQARPGEAATVTAKELDGGQYVRNRLRSKKVHGIDVRWLAKHKVVR